MINPQWQLHPPPQDLLSPVLELRDYYARLVEEYENLYMQARSQLDHVEALLSNWAGNPHKQEQLSISETTPPISTYFEQDSLSPISDSVAYPETQLIESEVFDFKESDTSKIYGSARVIVDNNESLRSNLSLSLDITPDTIKGTDIPMLPEYQSLTRMEAIKRLLEQHIGVVCHIDFIVRSLYGELESYIFRVVKGRVQSSLTQGREKQAWFGIPDEPGCYTLDLNLVSSNQTHTYHRHGKKNQKKPVVVTSTKVVPILAPYEGKFLIDVLTVFFKRHPGKVFGVDQVITGIYGKLNEEDTTEVRNKVLNELSRGHRTGRFSRLPETVGFYTLDLKLITKFR